MARRKKVRRRRSNAAMGYRGSRGARAKNLIPAKLKRMSNGRYKVYIAPGAMAKLRMR